MHRPIANRHICIHMRSSTSELFIISFTEFVCRSSFSQWTIHIQLFPQTIRVIKFASDRARSVDAWCAPYKPFGHLWSIVSSIRSCKCSVCMVHSSISHWCILVGFIVVTIASENTSYSCGSSSQQYEHSVQTLGFNGKQSFPSGLLECTICIQYELFVQTIAINKNIHVHTFASNNTNYVQTFCSY